MQLKRAELNTLIKSEVLKQEKKLQIENKIKSLEKELSLLNEEVGVVSAPVTNVVPAAKEEKSESIFDAKPGEIIIFNFRDVTIKAQRQLDDLFKITDAAESKKLKEGDYVKVQGNDLLIQNKHIKFVILREALKYESNPLLSWRIIKNK